jgi:chitinase
VRFQINGVDLGAEDTTASFGAVWDTAALANGVHVITVLARDAAGNVGTTSVTVTVNNDEPSTPDPALSFTASPSSIPAGQSATLAWSSQNTNNCAASGAWSGNKPLSGSQAVSPAANATYVLTCSGPGGEVRRSASVSIVSNNGPGNGPGGALDLTFNATPTSIKRGQSTTLSWSSENATGCVASGGWNGDKTVSGQQAVQPTSNTTYMLACSGPGGAVSRAVNVSVMSSDDDSREPSLSLQASDTRIRRGESVTITWATQGVNSCRAYGSWSGSKPLTGQIQVRPSRDARYTLWCRGTSGSVSESVRIDVRR